MTTDGSGIRQGIEAEYWVIDDTGALVDPGDIVAASDAAEREFVRPMIEVKTRPVSSTAELRRQFFEILADVLEGARADEKRLVPLGTPLARADITEREGDRTRLQNLVVGENFEYVRHCAGTHIHVEQDPERAMDQLNTMIALDPALALVNSSPYFRGQRLTRGARSELYRRMAYRDVPYQGKLWSYVESREAWVGRLHRRYHAFVRQAVTDGGNRATLTEAFEPETSVWTPVQLRETLNTVEWRSPDTTLPEHALSLVDQITDVLERLDGRTVRVEGKTGRVTDDAIVLPEFDTLTEYVDDAIQEGLSSQQLRSYLDRMGFEPSEFDPISRELSGRSFVSKPEARALRLEYAEKLERQVERASGA